MGISGNVLVCVTWIRSFPHTANLILHGSLPLARYYRIWLFSCSFYSFIFYLLISYSLTERINSFFLKCVVSSLVEKKRLLVIFHSYLLSAFFSLKSLNYWRLMSSEKMVEEMLCYCLWVHECMFHIWRLQSSEMKQSTFILSLPLFHIVPQGTEVLLWILLFFLALTLNMIPTQLKWLMGNNPHSFCGCMTLVFWGLLPYNMEKATMFSKSNIMSFIILDKWSKCSFWLGLQSIKIFPENIFKLLL